MTEKFIGPDAKIEAMSDEELDLVAGGAGTTYLSQPYAGADGTMLVSSVTVSGNHTYDPSTRTLGISSLVGSGSHSTLTLKASMLDSYKDRLTKRGNTLVMLDVAGPLIG